MFASVSTYLLELQSRPVGHSGGLHSRAGRNWITFPKMSIEEDLDHVACPGSCSRRTFFSHGKRAMLAGPIEAKTSPQKVAKG